MHNCWSSLVFVVEGLGKHCGGQGGAAGVAEENAEQLLYEIAEKLLANQRT
ncbi:MAG: hypothetical protein ACLSAP_09475 [Oscillospiraceae bacterium]